MEIKAERFIFIQQLNKSQVEELKVDFLDFDVYVIGNLGWQKKLLIWKYGGKKKVMKLLLRLERNGIFKTHGKNKIITMEVLTAVPK